MSPSPINLRLASLISSLHLVLLCLVLLGPLVSDRTLLLLYILTIPFIQIHWLANNDTCALTVAECHLRGINPDKSFFHSLVSPVYNLPEGSDGLLMWIASFLLWLLAISRFYSLGG
jgi:hypothetical protein